MGRMMAYPECCGIARVLPCWRLTGTALDCNASGTERSKSSQVPLHKAGCPAAQAPTGDATASTVRPKCVAGPAQSAIQWCAGQSTCKTAHSENTVWRKILTFAVFVRPCRSSQSSSEKSNPRSAPHLHGPVVELPAAAQTVVAQRLGKGSDPSASVALVAVT